MADFNFNAYLCGLNKKFRYSMIKLIKENRWYIVTILLIALGGILVLLFMPKDEVHLLINRYHAPLADTFFKYATWLGDGLFALVMCILLFFYKSRTAIVASLSALTTGLVVQVLKRVFFAFMARPTAWFDESVNLYIIEGVKLYHKYSFPSGHTATAFALFTSLALATKDNRIKALCLILGIIVGYSRMYLSQHFLPDVIAGMIIGVVFAFFFTFATNRHQSPNLDLPLHQILKKR
ncbi:MAG: phosphatase PAP2 family protein [Bacteroidota bacterium]